MHVALDDVPKEAVIWMPAHLKPGTCGTAVRGDGFLVEEVDVEANDAADKLAKAAVEKHRVPKMVRAAIKEHDDLVMENAMWIARAAAIASNQPGDPARDTEASKAKAAQAAAEKKKAKAAAVHFQSKKRGKEAARPKDQGGHSLERHGTGWWCTVCRRRSLTWHKLAHQACGGNAHDRWKSRATGTASLDTAVMKQHHVVESKPLMWCSACGAYGETAPKLLMQPCRGDPRGKIELMQMATQLRMIRRGEHPVTKARLGPPTTMHQLNGASNASGRPGEPSTLKHPPCIDNDGTQFSDAFRRRGIKPTCTTDKCNSLPCGGYL